MENIMRRTTGNGLKINRLTGFMLLAWALVTILSGRNCNAATTTYSVNITLSSSAVNPAALQQELVANSTIGQYLGKATLNPYFPNTYSIVIQGKNPAYQPPAVSTTLVTLDAVTKTLVKISSDTYFYGYVAGLGYERHVDLGLISNYLFNCSSPTYFTGASTKTWNADSCNVALGNASATIYQQNFSTPIIPGVGF